MKNHTILRLLIATRNPDKVSEIAQLVECLNIEVLDLSAFPDCPRTEETGANLEENALMKARTACDFTGLPVLADDTGLFVDALGGEPGVFSSRYAGENARYEDNCRLLVERMTGIPSERRNARFICVVALIIPGGEEKLFTGEVEGIILEEPGGSGGFGYDPIFYHPPSGKTFAELSLEEKNTLSHRSIAIRKAIQFLKGSLPSKRCSGPLP